MACLTQTLSEAIHKAVTYAIEEEVKKELAKLQVNVERQVRERIGGIAATICQRLSYERFGQDIKITVHFEKIEPKNNV